MDEFNAAEQRLAKTIALLKGMPILGASSEIEPWCKLRLIDLTKAIEVAEGITDPDEWVSVPCASLDQFEHSPHHWSEYRENETPLRIHHYCAGTKQQGTA